jgi:hypothetical protein
MKINKRARIKIKTKEKYRKIRSETGVGSPAASGSFYLIQEKREAGRAFLPSRRK